ncbi:hypothetical protein B0J12DRAFT_189153 [Macrophomina phaseolina]|uniref:Uncharacterized protein n=1 Tax=Macrophomina phaseolina TaxID=35725 RepID=A0ABQ8G427_9PEZI|nr:hypothetical protein B0J12DRAFT_189153 [Macrophomina phaseolina]
MDQFPGVFKDALKHIVRGGAGFRWVELPGAVRDTIQAYNEAQYGKQVRQQLPVVMALLESLVEQLGNRGYADGFHQFLSLLGVTAQFVQVLQGHSALRDVLQGVGVKMAENLEAQTGLRSPRFAKQVHRFIKHRAGETRADRTDHFFFVYHPDTDWHPEFFHRSKKDPLPTNFLGMSSSLDALCVWMLFIRSILAQDQSRRKSRFHILIPAYRPLVIQEPIIVPRELYPLTIEGHVHNSIFQVWLNIPGLPEGDSTLRDVGNLAAPPSFWQEWASALEAATSAGTFAAGGGVAAGVATAAAGTAAAPLAFLAVGVATMYGSVMAAKTVGEALRAPEPRLLGGDLDRDELRIKLRTRRVRRRHRRRRE